MDKGRYSAFLLLLVAISLPWPIRITSALVICWILSCLIESRFSFRYNRSSMFMMGLMVLYGLMHLFAWLREQSNDTHTWLEAEKKLALLFIPAMLLNQQVIIRKQDWIRTIRGFVFSLAAAGMTCLGWAIVKYYQTGDQAVFYYHELCSVIGHHSVYFSFQLLIAVVLMQSIPGFTMPANSALMLYPLFGIIFLLLSSKVMVPGALIILIWMVRKAMRIRIRVMEWLIYAGIGLVLVVVGSRNLVSRFQDIDLSQTASIQSSEFDQRRYFDGFNLRLIQVRFAHEILNSQNAWWFGVGPYKAQELLDGSYRKSNMWTGPNGHGGYIGLNFHNQYVETLVRFGMTGLFVFLLPMVILCSHAIRKRNTALLMVLFLSALFFTTESVIETQRGLISYLLFNLILFKQLQITTQRNEM